MRGTEQIHEEGEDVFTLLVASAERAHQNLLRACAVLGAIAAPDLACHHRRTDRLFGSMVGGVQSRAVEKREQMRPFMAQVLGQPPNPPRALPAAAKPLILTCSFNTGYDQASLDLNNLMVQAQQQCKSFGTAAVGYYNSTIVPEIQAAEQQVSSMNEGGRQNVKMSAAQFDSGGRIRNWLPWWW